MIDALLDALPQTQCRQCGCAGCEQYARAIADGAPINRCAPGGTAGISRLAAITHRPEIPLDPDYGTEAPLALAAIDSRRCIGCRLCAKACPVDAVTGAPKRLFAVIEDWCTGCALCLPACPMDCIHLVDAHRPWTTSDARRSRQRFEAKKARLAAKTREINARSHTSASQKSAVMADVLAQLAARRRAVS